MASVPSLTGNAPPRGGILESGYDGQNINPSDVPGVPGYGQNNDPGYGQNMLNGGRVSGGDGPGGVEGAEYVREGSQSELLGRAVWCAAYEGDVGRLLKLVDAGMYVCVVYVCMYVYVCVCMCGVCMYVCMYVCVVCCI